MFIVQGTYARKLFIGFKIDYVEDKINDILKVNTLSVKTWARISAPLADLSCPMPKYWTINFIKGTVGYIFKLKPWLYMH